MKKSSILNRNDRESLIKKSLIPSPSQVEERKRSNSVISTGSVISTASSNSPKLLKEKEQPNNLASKAYKQLEYPWEVTGKIISPRNSKGEIFLTKSLSKAMPLATEIQLYPWLPGRRKTCSKLNSLHKLLRKTRKRYQKP